MNNFDVIIIGAGAAGLMCAMRAGQRKKKVLLLDHAEKVGAKILISGGGRCNFTNLNASPNNYFSDNPHFCKSALKGYTQQDFIALVEKHNIAYHEKTLGQLFCDRSAQDIIDMLLDECRAGGVEIKTACKVRNVTKTEIYQIETDKGIFTSSSLVIACGGLSIPKIGASGFAYDLAKKFGLPLTPTLPALVPFTFAGKELAFMQELAGVALDVIASYGKIKFREAMVFTHRGLSGPAILQVSSVWCAGQSITLDLLPDVKPYEILLERKKSRPKAELKTILGELLPQRLAHALALTYFNNAPIHSYTDKRLQEIADTLKAWKLTPAGTEGYAKAEVTLGGIDTAALSSKTMEAKDVPGLYVIGEAVDVTGWLGGYNFQWAWSSGWAAGSAL